MAPKDHDAAFKKSNEVMAEWSSTIGGSLDTITEHNNDRINALKEQQLSVYERSRNIAYALFFIVSIAFIVTVILAYREVILPLRKQKAQLSDIIEGINTGKGDLTKRLTIKSNDEIGESSQGINKFIETLQKVMSNIISNYK